MLAVVALLAMQATLTSPPASRGPRDVRRAPGRGAARSSSAAADTSLRSSLAPPPTARAVVALRATRPPVLDGRGDDPIWQDAPAITRFVQWQPDEGAAPTFRTVAKIAYDAANLYVFVRACDPHPDSIIRILARRDTWTPSDMIWVWVDPFHDRRNGYEFMVNAAGVKYDAAIYHDGREDPAWNAVWSVVTRVDSLGWTAEFRIPLSQLPYSAAAEHTFGIAIDRDIYRLNERVSWPMLNPFKAGLVSQFGDLEGLTGLEAPRRLEVAPYLVTRDASTLKDNAFARRAGATLGADVKDRVAPNLTLHATVNPDFGEVEADPSVLNLGAFETYFSEQRPFFVAGSGLFQFPVTCTGGGCGSEGLFYSRRIGRPAQLWGTYGDTTPAPPTTILGAAKLAGRLPGGLTLGALDAVTARAGTGLGADTTVEPATNFAVVRVQQELGAGRTSFGGMATAVDRRMDAFTSPYLARGAWAAGLDFRHRFAGDAYEVAGSAASTDVAGSAAAIAALQTDPVHDYQRPDAGLPLDSSRTTLRGGAQALSFAKIAGRHLQFSTAYARTSAGFEPNDLGYLRRADQQSWSNWLGLYDRRPRPWYNSIQWNLNWSGRWTATGLPLDRSVGSSFDITFPSSASAWVSGNWGQLGATYDDRGARGGPAVRQDPFVTASAGYSGDARRAVVPHVGVNWFKGDAGHNWSFSVSPQLDVRLAERFTSSLAFSWSHGVTDNQWYGNYTDSAAVAHYTFAHLVQVTTAATLRLNYTFSPAVSLQVYAQPYVSEGTYTDVRQLSATPRASQYADRYAAYGDTAVTNHPGGFDFRAFQSNVVFRWGWRPGSALFLVWNEGRRGTADAASGSYAADLRELLGLHPANTFLMKVSYWLDP